MKISFNINWKKTLLIATDVVIGIYLIMSFASWHKPVDALMSCGKVIISVADENENAFLKSDDIKNLLQKNNLYPLFKPVNSINTRKIEQCLRQMPFVKTAQCYTSQQGDITIVVTQRTPVLRVKSASGDDYYIDDVGGIMPNSDYTSDMIIATGQFTRPYAMRQLFHLARFLMASDLWSNQIEQINVLPDSTIELVPRVGDHIINIGTLPILPNPRKQAEAITSHAERQMHRLELFYRHGLVHAGWKKYDYISLEYSNQIVCHRRGEGIPNERLEPTAAEEDSQEKTEDQLTEDNNNKKEKEDKETKNEKENKELTADKKKANPATQEKSAGKKENKSPHKEQKKNV